MNKLFLMGRLVADPEFSMTQNGIPMCRFRIAVDHGYAKQGEEKQADFFNITCWRQQAEFVNQWFTKGKPIIVEGKIQNNNYTDNNGVKHYSEQIIADNVSFTLSDPTRAGNGGQQNQQYQPNNGYRGGCQPNGQPNQYQQNPVQVQNQQYQADSLDEYEQISDGSLPF